LLDLCIYLYPRCQEVSYRLTLFLHTTSHDSSIPSILFGCCKRCGRELMVGSLSSCPIVSPHSDPSGASLCSPAGRIQLLHQLCLTIICSQINRMYSDREI
jgi:hypothetical protein